MSVRWGLIARSEDRGLGIQTWEIARNLKPTRTLLVDMGDLAGGFVMHPERFPGATIVPFRDGLLPESIVRDWLSGLDVVFSAETFYDGRFLGWAKDARVATVNQCNPEFCTAITDPRAPRPTQWWAPTPWHFESLPGDKILMPVPVAGDRFPMRSAGEHTPRRGLHIVGHAAAGDRAGTLAMMTALRYVRRHLDLTIAAQGSVLPSRRCAEFISIAHRPGGIGNYWDNYEGFDFLIAPRRYGGLSLPVQEAMAAGLAVIMTDVGPNDFWPTVRVAAVERGGLNTALGHTPLMMASPQALAAAIDAMTGERLAQAQQRSVQWARAHSWEVMTPVYMAALEVVAEKLK